jgi:hypothetical protein
MSRWRLILAAKQRDSRDSLSCVGTVGTVETVDSRTKGQLGQSRQSGSANVTTVPCVREITDGVYISLLKSPSLPLSRSQGQSGQSRRGSGLNTEQRPASRRHLSAVRRMGPPVHWHPSTKEWLRANDRAAFAYWFPNEPPAHAACGSGSVARGTRTPRLSLSAGTAGQRSQDATSSALSSAAETLSGARGF